MLIQIMENIVLQTRFPNIQCYLSFKYFILANPLFQEA
jgi:hypothetical protein